MSSSDDSKSNADSGKTPSPTTPKKSSHGHSHHKSGSHHGEHHSSKRSDAGHGSHGHSHSHGHKVSSHDAVKSTTALLAAASPPKSCSPAEELLRVEGMKDPHEIVAAMSASGASVSVLHEGCRSLTLLASAEPGKSECVGAGATAAAISALRSHGDDRGVATSALSLLSVLTTDKNHRCIPANASSASVGIPEIVSALKMHAEDDAAAGDACWCLKNLAVEPLAGNRLSIAQKGGIAAVVDALGKHKESAVFCEKACAALWNITANKDNQVTFASAGGIGTVMDVIRRFDGSREIAETATGVLRNAALNADNRPLLLKEDAIRVAAAVLGRHTASQDVLENCCGALLCLAALNDQSKAAVLDAIKDVSRKLKDLQKVSVVAALLKFLGL